MDETVSRVPAAQLQSLQAIATPTGQIVSETTLVTAEVRVCLKLFFNTGWKKSQALAGQPPYSRGLLRLTAELLLWAMRSEEIVLFAGAV